MPKVTLDKEMFKALASDTRLDILRTLDGKKLGLKDISNATNLNKATLHEHLTKLHEAGLVKRKEREGHKWVYYKLSWKGASLLHPENTRIVIMFTSTFAILFFGIAGLLNYIQNFLTIERGSDMIYIPTQDKVNETLVTFGERSFSTGQNPLFLYLTIVCLTIFSILMTASIWRYKKNKTPKL
jgi:DNA-binding transcriptional ArsR family regulator